MGCHRQDINKSIYSLGLPVQAPSIKTLWNGQLYWHSLLSCLFQMVWTETESLITVMYKWRRRGGKERGHGFCPVLKCSYLKPTAKWMFQHFYSMQLHCWVVMVFLGQLASWKQTPWGHPVISANETRMKLPGAQTRHIWHLHTITRSRYKGRGTALIISS